MNKSQQGQGPVNPKLQIPILMCNHRVHREIITEDAEISYSKKRFLRYFIHVPKGSLRERGPWGLHGLSLTFGL